MQLFEAIKSINLKNNKILHFHSLSFLLILAVIVISVWQGRYSIDAHHWGLMLSNAKDLYEGKLPYKEIFIQYGILTAVTHAVSYVFLGGNLIGLILITSIYYGIGLWVLYILAAYITSSNRLAFYVLVSAVLIHPIVIYPWSNYIAFPFLMIGVYGIIRYSNKYIYRFYSGMILGCAVLSREGLAPAVIVFICSSIIIDSFVNKSNYSQIIKSIFVSMIGLAIPVLLFFIYLNTLGLFPYWHIIAWQLPKSYATTMFAHMSGLNIFNPLFNTLINGFVELNARLIIFTVLFVTNLISICINILWLRKKNQAINYLKISIFTMLLVSSALHSPEIFRMSTGSVLGLITVYGVMKVLKIDVIFFVSSLFFLIPGITKSENGNIFFPTSSMIEISEKVNSPKYFKGQLWQKSRSEYYKNIEKDLKEIDQANCNITYHFNYTMDAFLQILSPFAQYQIAPFYTGEYISSLRSDIGSKGVMEAKRKIIILQMVQNIHRDVFNPPSDYYVYKKYFSPHIPFTPNDHSLLIMVPLDCKIKLDALISTK